MSLYILSYVFAINKWPESLLSTRANVPERWKTVLGAELIELQEFNKHYKHCETNYWDFFIILANCLAQKMKEFCWRQKHFWIVLFFQCIFGNSLVSRCITCECVPGRIGIFFSWVCLIYLAAASILNTKKTVTPANSLRQKNNIILRSTFFVRSTNHIENISILT